MKKLISMLCLGLLMSSVISAQDEEVVTQRETAPDATQVTLTEVAGGFDHPLYLTHAGDGSGRVFILQQTGEVYILNNGVTVTDPFIDLSDVASQDILRGYSERGLLGLAFHPNYAENGLFYVNYTDRGGTTIIAQYNVSADNPDMADPDSAKVLLEIDQPYFNHNGGHMAFGPDGYLYIASGDGGAANDPLSTGQDPSDLLGSILRIDVNSGDPYAIPDDNPSATDSTYAPEVWSMGLRNPWRFSFDRATGDLYIGDVGQNMWEEINFVPAGAPGGANFGWSNYEASQPFTTSQVPEGMIYPIAEYSHRNGDCSVNGGYVYRGTEVPELEAVYLFSDYCTGRIWATYRDTNGEWQTDVFMNLNRQVSSFGEDEAGELYVVAYDGSILKFTPAS